jgi:hypothetical protein
MAATPQVGDRAPDITVLGPGGEGRGLASYWSERPAILAFLRHFG